MKKYLAFAISCLLALGLAASARAESPRGVAPVLGNVTRQFDPPDQPWLSGHRGVDLAGMAGQSVRAALDGVVSFTGMVAGRPVISLRHGGLTTTYEPVVATVAVGESITAGHILGVLQAGHGSCPVDACLHWGLKEDDTYLDPLSLLGPTNIRLIAAADMATVEAHAADMERYGASSGVSVAGLISPAVGVVSSTYGMRFHPVTGDWKFHDGLDIAANCGSPIIAAAAGVVTESYFSPGYGNRVVIDHGPVIDSTLATSYSHAQSFTVSVGDEVHQGQVIGWVGTTGTSTGCHLHFQTWVDGNLSDPQTVLA